MRATCETAHLCASTTRHMGKRSLRLTVCRYKRAERLTFLWAYADSISTPRFFIERRHVFQWPTCPIRNRFQFYISLDISSLPIPHSTRDRQL